MEEDVKLEVLTSLRKDVKEVRCELRDIVKDFVGVKIVSGNNERNNRELQQDMVANGKDVVALAVKHEQLERRHVQHNKRLDVKIDSNYKDLRTDIQNIKVGIDKFQVKIFDEVNDIGKTIAKWSGRDSILKLLFGGVLGGILVGGVIILLGS